MYCKTNKKRCLFRAEVLQDIAESVGKATNHGLKTLNEAREANEVDDATEATSDTLD